MRVNKSLTLPLVMAASAIAQTPQAFPGQQWSLIASDTGVDPVLLYSVALAESASDRELNMTSPWPYAIRSSGKATYASSKEEAIELLEDALVGSERYEIDVGLMQINLHWHSHRVTSPAELLDPITNLRVGSHILAESLRSAPNDLVLGIGRYHTWKDEKRARWYGHRVLSIYNNILRENEVRK